MRKLKYEPLDVFQYIVATKRANNGNSPSMRDVMTEFRIPSQSNVKHIYSKLIDMGVITVIRGVSRSISVVGSEWVYEEETPYSSFN